MERLLFDKLKAWKNSKGRKPLIIRGARQVGKTWIMKEFGRREFKTVVYLNFESNVRLRKIFESDFEIDRIISVIEIETNQKIDALNTLLIFDEIQEVEKGLTSLKYFYEKAPQYFIVAAGSLLGISLQKNNSFPVGKVDFLELHPLNFLEFLNNLNQKQLLSHLMNKNWKVLEVFHDKLTELLRLYYFIGGMPEVVANYIENKNLETVRDLQHKIIIGYESDFAKHAPIEIVPRIKLVWNALISQLAKENKKFIYGLIKSGARAKDFETAIGWLIEAGLILKVNKLVKPTMPLNSYADYDSFKLFMLDIGLLNATAHLDKKILLEKNNILTEYKGALTEQFVCQQLKLNYDLYYWTAPNATAEIDFVVQHKNKVIPIEVKAEVNLKSKSMKVFFEKYNPANMIRASMRSFKKEKKLVDVPLYAIGLGLDY